MVNGILPRVFFALLYEVKRKFLRHRQLDPPILALVKFWGFQKLDNKQIPDRLGDQRDRQLRIAIDQLHVWGRPINLACFPLPLCRFALAVPDWPPVPGQM